MSKKQLVVAIAKAMAKKHYRPVLGGIASAAVAYLATSSKLAAILSGIAGGYATNHFVNLLKEVDEETLINYAHKLGIEIKENEK